MTTTAAPPAVTVRAPLGAATPAAQARRVAGATGAPAGRLLLCALPSDLAWARAWTGALGPAARRRVRLARLDGPALARADPCPRGLLVGPATTGLGAAGHARLVVPLAAAGYLAGAALGAALALADGPGPSEVRVAGPLAPTQANEALLSGLAEGLARTAPAATLLAVGGAAPPPKASVLLDPARPEALVRWRAGAVRGRCAVDRQALAAGLAFRLTGGPAPAASAAPFRCSLAPSTGPPADALAAARARLAQGYAPESLPDFGRPPLAVAPWQRAERPAPRRRR